MSRLSVVSFLRHRRRFEASLVLVLWFAAATAAAASRIVAVGDVHGDLPGFKAILAEAGVLDASGGWAGGETVLVQTGDLIDRGPSTRGTLDFVMALEKTAAERGGRVVSLLGNHEIMNITGDLRYVPASGYAEFADAGSEKRRAEAWLRVVELQKRRALKFGRPAPPPGSDARAAWFAAHPEGYLEYREAFGPGGVYGRWLRARPADFREQGTAFLHGGLSPALAGISLEEIDRRVHEDLATLDADRQLFVAEGLILPFFDQAETTRAVHEELDALDAAEAAVRTAAEKAGKTFAAGAENSERRRIYERFLEFGSWLINAADGPFWFRGYGHWSDAEGDVEMPRLLAAARVERFVVGHTVQPGGRIHVRFGGAVFLIDTGMLGAPFFPGGRGSALEISNGAVRALYAGEPRQVLQEAPLKAAAVLR